MRTVTIGILVAGLVGCGGARVAPRVGHDGGDARVADLGGAGEARVGDAGKGDGSVPDADPTCGALNQPCCGTIPCRGQWTTCAENGKVTDAGMLAMTCQACGMLYWQPCSPANASDNYGCMAGLAINPPTATSGSPDCVPCGGAGQPCCPSPDRYGNKTYNTNPCGAGLSCYLNSSRDFYYCWAPSSTCGDLGQPTCPNPSPLPGNPPDYWCVNPLIDPSGIGTPGTCSMKPDAR